MSFHGAAENIRVDEGRILRASLRNGAGQLVDAELDLNTIIGNSNGTFQWGAAGFADSAHDINFSVEGADNVPILRANLVNAEGQAVGADINLSERIGNNDGQFVFV